MAEPALRETWELRASPPHVAEDDASWLQRIIEAFRRRLWVFALTTAVVFLFVAFSTLTATRLYTATTDLQLDVQRMGVSQDTQQPFWGTSPGATVLETESEILRSHALAGRVVDALNLTADPEFGPQPGAPGLISRVRALFSNGAISPADEALARAARRQATIAALMSRTRVARHAQTLIIKISVTSAEPEKAARIANAFADNYLTMQLETKYETIATANEWLSNRLAALRDEVQIKERAVAEYRAQSGLLAAGATTQNEESAANLDLARAQSELAAAQARLASVTAGDGSQAALNSPVVAALRERQAELSRRRAEFSTTRGPRHPEMLQIDRETADLQQRIDAEVGRTTQMIRTEVRIARQRVASLQQSLGLNNNSDAPGQLRELEREAEASRTLYEGFLNRFRQVAETSGIERADARVTSAAAAPQHPSSPNRRLNLILGLLFGLGLGAIVVFVVELLEQSLRTPEDVQARIGEPCLGAIPFIDRRARTIDGELLSPEEFIIKRPLSAFGESLRSLRAGIFYSSPDRRMKVLAVTSALPEEGKTTTAIGLARISALAGSKTVIVDCDLRRRSATHCLGVEAEKGLTEVLFRTASLNEVIQRDAGTGVDIVPLAQAEFTPRDLFGSDAMKSLLEALRVRYDVVILDTAPVLPISDTRVLAPYCDGVLVVARWGRTPASVVRSAVERLRGHGAKIVGCVLEGVESGIVSRLLYDRPDYYSELYQTYYIR